MLSRAGKGNQKSNVIKQTAQEVADHIDHLPRPDSNSSLELDFDKINANTDLTKVNKSKQFMTI